HLFRFFGIFDPGEPRFSSESVRRGYPQEDLHHRIPAQEHVKTAGETAAANVLGKGENLKRILLGVSSTQLYADSQPDTRFPSAIFVLLAEGGVQARLQQIEINRLFKIALGAERIAEILINCLGRAGDDKDGNELCETQTCERLTN